MSEVKLYDNDGNHIPWDIFIEAAKEIQTDIQYEIDRQND